MKKSIQIKTVGIVKTRTNKSILDMFNFYVVLAGCDTAGLTHKGENSKIHPYKKVQKMKDLPKTWDSREKNFEDFRQKKNRNFIVNLLKNPRNIRHLKTAIKFGPSKQ